MSQYAKATFTPTFYNGLPRCSGHACQHFNADNSTVGKSECSLGKFEITIPEASLCQPTFGLLSGLVKSTDIQKKIVELETKKKCIELEIHIMESRESPFSNVKGPKEAVKVLRQHISKIDAELKDLTS